MSRRHFLHSISLLLLASLLILQLCLAAPQQRKDHEGCKDGSDEDDDDDTRKGKEHCGDGDDDDGLSALGIIGIIVGIILFGLGVAALACYCCVCCCCAARANRTTSRGRVISPGARGAPPTSTVSGDLSKKETLPTSVHPRPPPAYENYERKVEPSVDDTMANLHRVIYSEPPAEAGLDYPPAYHEIDLDAPNAPPPEPYYGNNDPIDSYPVKH